MTPVSILANVHLWSIVLGVLAWLMGVWAIVRYKVWKFTISYLFCAVALLLQLFAVKESAFKGDYSSIEDTIRWIVFAGIFMLVVTVILHAAAFFKFKSAQRKAKKEAAN